MKELVDILGLFLSLDVLYESQHALLFEGLSEDLGNEGVHVEPSKGNELPAVAHLSQVGDKVLHVVLGHLLGIPIEARREVVGQEDVGLKGVDTIGELLGHGEIGGRSLHPEHISIVSEGEATLDRVGNRTVDAVVALICAAALPVEVKFETVLTGHILSISKRHMKAVIVPKLNHFFSLLTLEVLNDGNAACLRESEKLRRLLGINASKNERVINRVNIAI
jgi:hypothetical protein